MAGAVRLVFRGQLQRLTQDAPRPFSSTANTRRVGGDFEQHIRPGSQEIDRVKILSVDHGSRGVACPRPAAPASRACTSSVSARKATWWIVPAPCRPIEGASELASGRSPRPGHRRGLAAATALPRPRSRGPPRYSRRPRSEAARWGARSRFPQRDGMEPVERIAALAVPVSDQFDWRTVGSRSMRTRAPKRFLRPVEADRPLCEVLHPAVEAALRHGIGNRPAPCRGPRGRGLRRRRGKKVRIVPGLPAASP